MATTPTPRTSQRFCASDADLTISSSDNVLFKVHRKHLEVHSDVFADAANATRPENGDEIVYLQESSEVLELLFQFMYRQRQPDLRHVEFPKFMEFAEAVDKYVVYSALSAMESQMRVHITDHPLRVLDFSAIHGHADLGNEAARIAVGLSMSSAAAILSPHTFTKWMAFHDEWHAGAMNAVAEFLSLLRRHSREELSSSLEACVRDPKRWYTERSTLQNYTWANELTFLDIEFMQPTDNDSL
ncbi:BTB domain-containing protein [Mycena sanguinolenta]|uniref:BTB domain-containing protein n=1 Tax=Mycena sanguinolenta TaxID=230812 RepID=A0A8H6XYP4_9AGAR|nr:BTB domain-containing protein [Mycena sanguinolenta]